jgi:nucleotide-binding universal stress UspA family protein
MNESGEKLVIVGVDGSPTARKAAESAAELARALGAKLHLVSALSSTRSRTITGPGSDEFYVDDVGDTETDLRSLATAFPDLDVDIAIETGKPADVLVDVAERLGADVIVVGNKRMHGISRILGAVASDVAHQANCDVYIVNTIGASED